MVEKLQEFWKRVKKAGPRTVILVVLVPVCFCIFTVWFINNYLEVRYELISVEDALKVASVSHEFRDYLDEVEIFVDTCAEGVEYLVSQNADHETIHNYLQKEYENLDGNITEEEKDFLEDNCHNYNCRSGFGIYFIGDILGGIYEKDL